VAAIRRLASRQFGRRGGRPEERRHFTGRFATAKAARGGAGRLRACLRATGQVSEAEIGEIFFELDTNHDGCLEEAEFRANFKAVAAKHAVLCKCPEATSRLEKAIFEAADTRAAPSSP